jgi:hypothetical protein
MSPDTPSCVQKLQAASHEPSCVFSESRMREICLSGSMSGPGNRAMPNQTEATTRKQLAATGRLKPLRLFSTLLIIALVDLCRSRRGSAIEKPTLRCCNVFEVTDTLV